MHKKNGFTLIELMIVVSVIGVLAGVTMRIIDPQHQKAIAEDAVVQQRVSDLAVAIETYRTAEGSYPDEGTTNNPLESEATGDIAAVYIANWPEGFVYNVSGDSFSIHATKSTSNDIYKYSSSWDEVRECGSTTSDSLVDSCADFTNDEEEPSDDSTLPVEPPADEDSENDDTAPEEPAPDDDPTVDEPPADEPIIWDPTADELPVVPIPPSEIDEPIIGDPPADDLPVVPGPEYVLF